MSLAQTVQPSRCVLPGCRRQFTEQGNGRTLLHVSRSRPFRRHRLALRHDTRCDSKGGCAMQGHAADKMFAGSIPQLYETYLVPLIFEPYARDFSGRLAARSPTAVLESAPRTGGLASVRS